MKSIIDPSALFIDLDVQKRPAVISVVGAGGKTSLLFWLAEVLRASGRRVLITTTTHMFMPVSHWPVVFAVILQHFLMRLSHLPFYFVFIVGKRYRGKHRDFRQMPLMHWRNGRNVT